MSLSKNECPVPFDQQPLNEYLSLKQSWLFNWSSYAIKKYLYVMTVIFLMLFVVLGIIFICFFDKLFSPWKIFILDILVIDVILGIILMRLYLGWSYIMKRLLSASIFYEESGWYDGQIWLKKSDNLIQDRLVGLYQVLPIVKKVKYSLICISINLVISFLLYFIL